jgi:hypothetical protein
VRTASVDSLRAGINPAPTQWVGEPFVGAGFMPARSGYDSIQITQFRSYINRVDADVGLRIADCGMGGGMELGAWGTELAIETVMNFL